VLRLTPMLGKVFIVWPVLPAPLPASRLLERHQKGPGSMPAVCAWDARSSESGWRDQADVSTRAGTESVC
jgi:hypothetical protein